MGVGHAAVRERVRAGAAPREPRRPARLARRAVRTYSIVVDASPATTPVPVPAAAPPGLGPAHAAEPAAAWPQVWPARAGGRHGGEPLEALHPALWRAHQMGRQRGSAVPTGFEALDAVLPGGGWPVQALTELLLPHPGLGEVRLLAPALAAVQQQHRSVMLFDPPALPYGWTLAACGLDLEQLYVVQGRGRGRQAEAVRQRLPAADVLWALEQALKSGLVGAVLAWLPARLAADALRRLQLAAQAHDGPVFLLRDEVVGSRPSPAPLRLLLRPAGADELRLAVLKRRGPPLAQPLVLPLPPVLSDTARARADALAPAGPAAALATTPAPETLR